MSALYLLFLTLFSPILINSCSSPEIRFNNKLKGTWEIKTIETTFGLNPGGFFTFNECELTENSRSLCDVSFQIAENNLVNAKYTFITSRKDKLASITFILTDVESLSDYFPQGPFEVEELSKKQLTLRGNLVKWNRSTEVAEATEVVTIELAKIR